MIAVPVVWIAPSRKAASMKARVSSGLQVLVLDDLVQLGLAARCDVGTPLVVDVAGGRDASRRSPR